MAESKPAQVRYSDGWLRHDIPGSLFFINEGRTRALAAETASYVQSRGLDPGETPEASQAMTTADSILREVIFLQLRSAWSAGMDLPGRVPDPEPDTRAETAFAASADAILAAAGQQSADSRDGYVAAIREQLIAARLTGRNVKLGWATPEGFFETATDAVLAAVTAG